MASAAAPASSRSIDPHYRARGWTGAAQSVTLIADAKTMDRNPGQRGGRDSRQRGYAAYCRNDDVGHVYANFDISDEEMAKIQP